MTLLIVCSVLGGCVVSAAATGVMRWLAPRCGLVDQPAARKVHVTPTPLGGGVGIWLGVMLPIAGVQFLSTVVATHIGSGNSPDWLPGELAVHVAGVASRSGQMWMILAAGSVLAVMGLIDDLRQLPWQPRLAIQVGVAAFLVFFVGVKATLFVPIPLLSELLSLLWILVLVNAFNFLDNMDGLSSGIALIASLLFAVVMLTGTGDPHWFVAGLALVLAGSLGGFLLFHNWPPAKIFMGDAGSMFIGMLLASLTLLGTYYEHGATGSRHVILAPLCILAVPLYDFCSVMIIRLSQRRSPFHPDKSHFSHRLVDRGLSRTGAVLTIHLATLTTGIGALLLYEVAGWTGAFQVLGLVVSVLCIVAILEFAGRNGGAER